jgi:hypothetical protein
LPAGACATENTAIIKATLNTAAIRLRYLIISSIGN